MRRGTDIGRRGGRLGRDIRVRAILLVVSLGGLFTGLEQGYLAPRAQALAGLDAQRTALEGAARALGEVRAQQAALHAEMEKIIAGGAVDPDPRTYPFAGPGYPDTRLARLKPLPGDMPLTGCRGWSAVFEGSARAVAGLLEGILADAGRFALTRLDWRKESLEMAFCVLEPIHIAASGRSGLNALPPDVSGVIAVPPGVMGHLPLSELKLSGTSLGPAGGRAVFAGPEGLPVSLAIGARLGREGARLTHVGHGAVELMAEGRAIRLRVGEQQKKQQEE